MRKSDTVNPMFGRFDDVLKSVMGIPTDNTPGTFWGNKKTLTFADMFCGIGGFHVAAETLGMKCLFACDIDEDCRKIYEHNFHLKPASDICRVKPASVPDHDVLFAGFPCQPFSIIGNRGGFSDSRGTLFFELAKVIKAKQPQAVVLENVRMLASHNEGKTLERITAALKELGYWVDHKIFNALDFGLPQKRERILIVGFKGGVSGFKWPTRKLPMIPLKEILESDPDPRCFVSERIRRKRHADHTAKETPSIWHENKAGHISSYPYSCALRAGASYNYLLVNGDRRLTPRELLRLQGFPESFEIVGNDAAIRKQTGNSVPVPMVKAVVERVLYAARADKAQRNIAAA
jgi:DNA (cytosine-5)-methyltransferase 1